MVDVNEFVTNFGAFPSTTSNGMSLRDYFAAAALTGLCANSHFAQHGDVVINGNAVSMERAVWGIADAMLAAREGE